MTARRRLVKSEFIFTSEIRYCIDLFCSPMANNTKPAFNSEWKHEKLVLVVRIPQTTQNWSFHVAVLQRTAKKCTKIYNARVQLLFCSLNLLFSDVFVAVVVVVCLSCLFKSEDSTTMFNLKGSGPRHNQRSARNSIPSSPRPLSKFLPCP